MEVLNYSIGTSNALSEIKDSRSLKILNLGCIVLDDKAMSAIESLPSLVELTGLRPVHKKDDSYLDKLF